MIAPCRDDHRHDRPPDGDALRSGGGELALRSLSYRVHLVGTRWRWELLAHDDQVIRRGSTDTSTRARAAAWGAGIRILERPDPAPRVRARNGLGMTRSAKQPRGGRTSGANSSVFVVCAKEPDEPFPWESTG